MCGVDGGLTRQQYRRPGGSMIFSASLTGSVRALPQRLRTSRSHRPTAGVAAGARRPGWPRATRLLPGVAKGKAGARGVADGAMEVGHRAAGSPVGPRGDRGAKCAGRGRYASFRPILRGFKATRLCCRVAFRVPAGLPAGKSRGGWSADKTEPAVLFAGCCLLVLWWVVAAAQRGSESGRPVV